MPTPTIVVHRIGVEAQPLVVIDDFAPDPDALRAAAIGTRFAAAAHYYPGTRAPLSADYLPTQRPLIAAALAQAFDAQAGFHLIDASFSLVTRTPAALTIGQRLPHCDAHAPERIALVHFLSPDRTDGTAFFRHRATGFETIDEARAPEFNRRLAAELRESERPAGYIDGDTALFERVALVGARYNRALLYRSFLLHSGAITPAEPLSPDPATGRLTITAFFAVAR